MPRVRRHWRRGQGWVGPYYRRPAGFSSVVWIIIAVVVVIILLATLSD